MKTILLLFISDQLWQTQVHSKPASKPWGWGGQSLKKPGHNTQLNVLNNRTEMPNRRINAFFGPSTAYLQFAPPGAMSYGQMTRMDKTLAPTTVIVLFDNDCDYINYYCMRGYYTGNICAKTIYNTYETFSSYCELEYINCMEQYDLWTIAHMGICYNVSSYETFAYYAYAIWDDEQLEELYVMPEVG